MMASMFRLVFALAAFLVAVSSTNFPADASNISTHQLDPSPRNPELPIDCWNYCGGVDRIVATTAASWFCSYWAGRVMRRLESRGYCIAVVLILIGWYRSRWRPPRGCERQIVSALSPRSVLSCNLPTDLGTATMMVGWFSCHSSHSGMIIVLSTVS